MMNQYTVYSVIATYNGMQWIERCLNSLLASTQNNYIIVIDNGSKDNTVGFIQTNYPMVQLIETGKNLGFGQANNIGLAIALKNKADYVFLLNQDAWVETDTITNLINVHIANPAYGILSPVHMNGAGNDFDPIFYKYLTVSDTRQLLMAAIVDKSGPQDVVNTDFVNAAAWLISSDCLSKTGGFDPVFFHYGEDDNYAHRVLHHGFKIGVLPTTKIYHDKEYNMKENFEDMRLLFKRDRIIFLHQACDIRNPNYRSLMAKRFARYTFLTFFNLIALRKEAFFYNFSMTKHIVLSYSKIKQSRAVSANALSPYLNFTDKY